MKVLQTFLVVSLLCVSLACAADSTIKPRPYPIGAQRNSIIHLFEWTWPEIAKECTEYLGPNGFGAVQVSPVQEHVWDIVSDSGYKNPWWVRYQPVSYKIDSRSGNETQFIEMVQNCTAAGVDIYVDVVANHMAGDNRGKPGYAGSNYSAAQYSYPDWQYSNFHHDENNCVISGSDYTLGNTNHIRRCRLEGMPDLATDSRPVQDRLVKFLNHLISLGVTGFRFDAAKHMEPSDLTAIVSRLDKCPSTGNKPFIFHEVIGSKNCNAWDYYDSGMVTDFQWGMEVGRKYNYNGGAPGDLVRYQINEKWSGVLVSYKSLNFLYNHDNIRSGIDLSVRSNKRRTHRAHLFELAYPHGYPRIMSSYSFEHNDQGPPVCGNEGIACDRTHPAWVMEHRWTGVAGLAQFRGVTMPAFFFSNVYVSNDGNQFAFSRGNLGFFAQTNAGTMNTWLFTGLPEGEYCNVAQDSFLSEDGTQCTGASVHVFKDGRASIVLYDDDNRHTCALHVGARITAKSTKDAHIALPPLPEDEVISIPENHIPITIDQPIVEPIVEPIAASSSTAQTSSSSRHLIFIAIGAAGVCAAVALVIGAVVAIRRHRAERARYSLLDNEI